MDPTMQQAVSDPPTSQADQDINGLTTEMENADIAAEETTTVTPSAEVPTYDQQFPSLGGGLGGAGPETNAPNPFGRWNTKPRVQSSTITQVKQNLDLKKLHIFASINEAFVTYGTFSILNTCLKAISEVHLNGRKWHQ